MAPDRYILSFFISGTVLFVLFTFFLVAYLIVHKNKQNAYLIEKNKMLHEHEMNILSTRLEEQERTVNHLSKEIHDNILQILTFVNINLHDLENEDRVHDTMGTLTLARNAKTQVEKAMNELRALSHALNGEYIQTRGLADALEKTLDSISSSKNIFCHFQIEGIYMSFEVEKELLIYRIAQEAIHNVVRHSKASAVIIELLYETDTFILSVTDNGTGFDPSESESDGIGILNMKARAKALNGVLKIHSSRGEGCRISLTLKY